MATIGLSIESGSMHAVLFDSATDAVVASQVTSLAGGESTSLPTAVEAMRAIAVRRSIDVDATALVYRSPDERNRFAAAVEGSELEALQLVSASSAFLRWLSRSPEFESADCVLLYYIGSGGVSVSLADAENDVLSTPKTAVLDSMSPEHIGGTVPLAWEVLDDAGRKPDAVALFGDRSSNRDLVDILALGLGVPVVRVADADEIAARGAALLAASAGPPPTEAAVDEVPASVVTAAARPVVPAKRVVPAGAASVTSLAPSVAPLLPTVRPRPVSEEQVPIALAVRKPLPRKKIVLTAALLAGVLSGGVALASTLPNNTPTRTTTEDVASADSAGVDASLVRATQTVEVTQPPAPVEPPPPVLIDPVTQQPIIAPAPETQWTIDPTTGVARPSSEALTPIPAAAIPPAAAVVPRQTVEPPVFAVPTIVPEPGKSEEQLQQEAWDRHWQHTAEWLEQEIVGN